MSDSRTPGPVPTTAHPQQLPHPGGLAGQSHWYQHAVFYEVLPRSFFDHSGAGTGTLAGITAKLDYLAWLGVDCLWIPPFFTSPLRDGGYDVSDYFDVLPAFGTVEDARELVAQAHARGLRVIGDLVVNHTSDAHPWFQHSRRDPEGPFGDFYVWRDTDEEYGDARIIFVDTERSNWSFDEVRGQYYWHRFFSHQPDLNYDNPAVVDAIEDVVRFWFDLGLDGLRLDAVPYLIERDGTNCENLPGTHAIIARLRQLIDAEYPGRILLAEANQWPEDVVEYFGTPAAPECHMCFHFPLMPRLFLSLDQQDGTSVREILAATPQIPAGAQWGTFLRNHDELTLEMVTDEEREKMYAAYAPAPRMRANVGIRRRLKPLLGGDEDKVMLLQQVLLGLPGSPCLYYGDEIGMGDDISLPDRDGVRTPMQWDGSALGGFSTTADAAGVYPPVISDPDYGPAGTNVAAQVGVASSLLERTRRLLAARALAPVLATGECDFVDVATTPAPPVAEDGRRTQPLLMWVRHGAGARPVLCVANMSATAYSFTARIEPEWLGESSGATEWVAEDVFATLAGGAGQSRDLVCDPARQPDVIDLEPVAAPGAPGAPRALMATGSIAPWSCQWFFLSPTSAGAGAQTPDAAAVEAGR